MMDKLFKQGLLVFVVSNLLILWLYIFSGSFVVDVSIVTANIFTFVLNNIYIFAYCLKLLIIIIRLKIIL